MSRRSDYVGFFGNLKVPVDPNVDNEWKEIQEFSHENGILSFKIVRFHEKSVPVRYTTVNYEKHPVEWKNSIRSAVEYKINKKISAERYAEIELPLLNFSSEIKEEICRLINYYPSWKIKERDIQKKQIEINECNSKIKKLLNEEEKLICALSPIKNKIDEYDEMKCNLALTPTSIGIKILKIIFCIPTIGLSMLGFVTKKKASENQEKFFKYEIKIKDLEKEYSKKEKDVKKSVHEENLMITKDNKKINDLINKKKSELERIELKDYKNVEVEDGFIDLRKSLKIINKFNTKGVYIIWNKTKNKYYVGQSKDIYKRIFTQHFNNCEVKNIIFAKDWYNNDVFLYKIIPLETKDIMDEIEMENINKYGSFVSGYNSTGGNK